MATWGSCDFRQLQELQKKLNSLKDQEFQQFWTLVSKELAARLLRMAVNNTPTGQYPAESGKVGGTLKRGWTGRRDVEPTTYAMKLPVERIANGYIITIINPVKYASYVEYGHRQTPGRFVPALGKRLKKSWVDGQFMLTNAEAVLEKNLPKIIEKKITKFLEDKLK